MSDERLSVSADPSIIELVADHYVLLGRNPNNVQEWEKRVTLWGQKDKRYVILCSFSAENFSA